MPAKILVALDGSKTSESILPYLESLLRYRDANVTLAMATAVDQPTEQLDAHDYLKGVAGKLRRKGAVVDVEVLTGRPAEALTAYAATRGYELLALCSRGKTGLKRLIFGSTAEEVLQTSTVPVFVAHPVVGNETPSPIRKIIVPLDGSHRSAAVVPAAGALAKAFGAKLCFVTVVSPYKKSELPVETVAHNLFRDQKALQAKGLEVDVAVLYGEPAAKILAFAEENGADLIALSTHGRTGLDRVLFGSTAETLLRKSTRPLYVVRSAAVPKTRGKSGAAGKAKHRALQAMGAMKLEVPKSYSS